VRPDELSTGIELIHAVATEFALSVRTDRVDQFRGVLRLSFELSKPAIPHASQAISYDFTREFVDDLPGTKEHKAALTHFLRSLSLRLVQPRPLQFMTLRRIPIELEIHWPFRHAQDRDSDSVHVLVRTGSPWSHEANLSVRIWGPDRLQLGILSISPAAIESLVVNSIRLFIDQGRVHFHPVGRTDELQEVELTPTLFERQPPRDTEVDDFFQRKIYWLGFREGDDKTLVPIVDPYDSPYVGCDGKRLRQIARILAAKHSMLIDASGDYAQATDHLLQRATDFERDWRFAVSPDAAPLSVTAKDKLAAERPTAKVESRSPLVFLSYSWDNEEHLNWVLDLATRLRQQDAVDVILDRWHLRPGMDRTAFMEQSVAGSDFVVLVCTPSYATRANARKGGVGYESTIITGDLAENLDTDRFIPVLRSGSWDTAVPRWIKTRLGLDLTGEPYSEDEYRTLVQTLHRSLPDAPNLGQRSEILSTPRSERAKILHGWLHFNQQKTAKNDGELLCDELISGNFVSHTVPAPASMRKIVEEIAKHSQKPIPIDSLAEALSEPVLSRGKVLFGSPGDCIDGIMANYDNLEWWISNKGLNVTVRDSR
jgi:TIR domain